MRNYNEFCKAKHINFHFDIWVCKGFDRDFEVSEASSGAGPLTNPH